MTEELARARPMRRGAQVAHVTVRDGYRPHTIAARAGVPLRLVFHRDEDTPCSERVVFSSPHLDRHLTAHGETNVDLPAQGPGDVRFTCGMGRYRGLIRLSQLPADRRLPARWQRPARTDGAAAGVVLVLLATVVASVTVPMPGPAPWLAALVILALVGWLVARVFGATPLSR